jgi:hypothetical protein
MLNRFYAEVTSKCVNVFSTKANDVAVFELPLSENAFYKIKPAVIVANLRQTVIRVADIPRKPAKNKWNLVQSAFPIGEKMNEDTYNFDGTVLKNKDGAMRFLMAALPAQAVNEIEGFGAKLFGSLYNIKRLDTVENFLFQYYAKKKEEPFLCIFPQGDGLRVLFLTEGLPKAAWRVRNNPNFREEEIIRCLQALGHNEAALTQAAVLNTNFDLDWLCVLLENKGVKTEQENFFLRKFIAD